jgi:hypothetical protein
MINYKNYILISVFLFFTEFIDAQISKRDIALAADNFISENRSFKDYTQKPSIIDLYSENKRIAHLVNLNPQGFIIFTSSEKMYPVFSYSETGNFNFEEADKNPVFQSLFNLLRKKTEAIENNPAKFSDIIKKNKASWEALINGAKHTKEDYLYGYYLTDSWGGVNCWDNEGNAVYPSNYYTPNHYSPGCVAISSAQILNYYEWPPIGVGDHTDNDNTGSSQGTYYAAFGMTEYDWANMLNDYQGEYSTDEEQRAIGRLMYHTAVSVDMDFENAGSTSNVNKIPNAFSSYFRSTGYYQTFSWSEFQSRLQQNLINGMPVQFGIEADNGEQHACVCDGYKYNEGDPENQKFYHLNMGWWNLYGGNAWYRIFDDFNAIGYTIITGGVFDIIPEPLMNEAVRTSDYHTFIVNWNISKNLNWEAFELQESYNNGAWTTLSNSVTDTLFQRTVSADGIYKYRVMPKVAGNFYADSWSNMSVVQVGEIIYLDFDGDDSFFVNDNEYNNLDISNEWTIEAWVKVDSYTDGTWSVIADRRGVFSLYLLDDADADFAVRFAVRDGSDNITASLRSDNSAYNLQFNKWFHAAISFDGTTARLFLNGNLIEEITDTNFNLTSSTNALNIGARYWGSYSRNLDGKIDQIRISQKAYYTEEFCPDRFELFTKNPEDILLLNLQYGEGTTLYDASHHFLYPSLRSSPNTATWQTEPVPIVNIQAENAALCNGNTSFSINATNTDTYQWQYNSGSGFINFVDNSNISGANTNTLNINEVSGFAQNNIIRCVLSNTNVPHTCSDNVRLDVYGNCTVWNGTTWSNSLPDENKSAIVNANYTANDFLTCDNLSINENDTLFINENFTLDVRGDFLNKGTLFLMSENVEQIPGTFIHGGTVTNYGNMIAAKMFAAENKTYFSNPTNSLNSISNTFNNNPDIYENTGNITEWNLLNQDDKLTKAKAYLYSNSFSDKAEFSGLFNTGYEYYSMKVIDDDDFFAFTTNPYPSYIWWNAPTGWIKENVDASIYTYNGFNNGNSFNYSVWDGTVGIHSGNGYIKPLESYFVQMADFRSKLEFDNSVRVLNSEVQPTISNPDNLIRFQFETQDASIIDEAVLYFSDSYSESLKILPFSESKHYTFFPSGFNKYAILRINMTEIDTLISVGFKTSAGGEIKFKVTDFTFDGNTPVQLKDLWTGETMMLTNGSEYTFTAGTSEPDNRFKLYFGDYVSSVTDFQDFEDIKVWSYEKTIHIENNTDETFFTRIYDISGKLIFENSYSNKHVNINNINQGIKFIQIRTKEKSFTKKIIIY